MKKRYKREAYYLDDGVLLHGYKDKRGFHPDPEIQCGFGTQGLNKRAVGKELFFSLGSAIKKLGKVELAGGEFIVAIDLGFAVIKAVVVGEHGKFEKHYQIETSHFGEKNDVSELTARNIIKECFRSFGVIEMNDVEIEYAFAYPFNINSRKIRINDSVFAVVKKYATNEPSTEDDGDDNFEDWVYKPYSNQEIYEKMMELTGNDHEIASEAAIWCKTAKPYDTYVFREGEIEIQLID